VISLTDLLAVPDFSSGAMENWGLVSFREDRIMFDEKIVSILQKQQLGETMAHEIAHFCRTIDARRFSTF
jgi:aminopeptidase N